MNKSDYDLHIDKLFYYSQCSKSSWCW